VSLPTRLLVHRNSLPDECDSYLAAFQKESLKEFFVAFEKWELEEVLKDIDPVSSVSGDYLEQSQKSDTMLYRMLFNWTLFCNAQVLAYLESHIPADLPNSWANLPLPPGILVLLVARNTEVRTWASSYALGTQLLEPKLFIGSYLKALGVVHSVLQLPQSETSQPSLISSTAARPSSEIPPLKYAKASEFWPGFNIILRVIPPNYLKSNCPQPLVLRRDIFSHLRDNDSRS
jgi:senataxin